MVGKDWRTTEKRRAYKKMYYQLHKEEFRKRSAKRYQEKYSEVRAMKIKYWQENKDRFKDLNLKHNFGISLEEYFLFEAFQNYRCAICKRKEVGRKGQKYFCVDHDHKTGKVRGLLCSPCNLILGIIKDNPNTLTSAAAYLRNGGYGA